MNLLTSLRDPARYLDQIDRLHEKNSRLHRLYDVGQDGVSLASLCMNRKKVARLLARSVSAGEYQLAPPKLQWVNINGKSRRLYRLRPTDVIVHGVVSGIINESMKSALTTQVYSYQKGIHWWKAVSDLAKYVRKHRRLRPDSKQRGLYVLRRDILSYTDSIPVGDRSPLWEQLKSLLGLDPVKDAKSRAYWGLIQKVVRPETYTENGGLFCNTHGVPTGSPIANTLFNFYLIPLDNALAAIPDGFYARYSDDLLFAHPDPGMVREAETRLATILEGLCLEANQSKAEDLFFNGAGRPSPAWPEAKGTTVVAFLGCHVAFDGTVALKPAKVRRLLNDLKVRIRRTLRELPDRDPTATGPVICSAVNEALKPASPCRQKSAVLLASVVTSRPQLKQIDYAIARIIAGALTGDSTVRAFRRVSYRTLRERWQLISLFHRRNQKRAAH